MRFLVDAQLPPAFAEWLRDQGHVASHVITDIGHAVSDETLWTLALETDAVIVSKDRDFPIWAVSRRPAPVVIWIRLGNATARSLISWIEPRWAEIEGELGGGAKLIEVGRR